MNSAWETAQKWELDWHGNCINSLNEELKQIVYARKMGILSKPTPKTPYNFDLEGASVLDIGGGAYSLLLKCVNYKRSMVADPLMDKYPSWVIERYKTAGIDTLAVRGEDIDLPDVFDECWIYNVLEHTEDPAKVVASALNHARIVRVFEWLDVGVNIGHIHTLREEKLNSWLGGEGKVEMLNENGAVGKSYYGIFKGKHYVAPSSQG